MLAILFPHLFEDIEFLLPNGGDSMDVELGLPDFSQESQVSTGPGCSAHVNAEAGPSRLH